MEESFKEFAKRSAKQFFERLVFVLVIFFCIFVLMVGMTVIDKNPWLVVPIDLYLFIVLAIVPVDDQYFRLNFVAMTVLMFASLATVWNIPIVFFFGMLALMIRGFGLKKMKNWIFEKKKTKKIPVVEQANMDVEQSPTITVHKLEDLPLHVTGYSFDDVNIGDEIIVPWRLMSDAIWQGTVVNLQNRLDTLGASMFWGQEFSKGVADEPAYRIKILKLKESNLGKKRHFPGQIVLRN